MIKSLKMVLCTLVLTLAMAVPSLAADNGFYLGLKFLDSIQSTGSVSKSGAVSVFEADNYTQNTVGGGVFIGYDFYPVNQIPLRAELEYAIRTNSTTTWNDKLGAGVSFNAEWGLQTLFLNAYLDFHNSTKFTPYIGAGLGMGFISNKYEIEYHGMSRSVNDTQTVFAWNAGLGCAYAITDNLSADLAYRFVGLGYNETEKTIYGFDNKIGMSPYANEFSLGIRYTF